jgi:hypothetical protein
MNLVDCYSQETPGYDVSAQITGPGSMNPLYGPTFPACELGDWIEWDFGLFVWMDARSSWASGKVAATNLGSTLQFTVAVNAGAAEPLTNNPQFGLLWDNDLGVYGTTIGPSAAYKYQSFAFGGVHQCVAADVGNSLTFGVQINAPATPTTHQDITGYAMQYFKAKRYR